MTRLEKTKIKESAKKYFEEVKDSEEMFGIDHKYTVMWRAKYGAILDLADLLNIDIWEEE